MTVLPVLDLLEGLVVRGVAGRRTEYRPLRSRLVETAVPLDVARALRDEFCYRRLYIADLDGILHRRPNWVVYQQLIDDGFKLLVDAGYTLSKITPVGQFRWSTHVELAASFCREPWWITAK